MDDNHDKPDPIDLPETDLPETEDNGPAKPSLARRLLMARELRGWVVAAAALMVAAAAVAPDIAGSDLTSALKAPSVGAISGEGCNDEDQSGGFGGQHVGCDFTCSDGVGDVSVSVDADDNDASVSGSAECGGGDAHCSGMESCNGSDARDGGGDGSCSADSDEAIDSGLYVECSATLSGHFDDFGPNGEACVVTEPAPVCIQPACNQLKSTLADKCQLVWQQIAPTITTTSTVVAFLVQGGEGAGLSCQGFVCLPIEPTCFQRGAVNVCTA